MLKSSGAMGAATMASRLLGLVREQAYAAFMGNTMQASAFFFAFNIPNLFRRLLGEGVLSAAFIPIFKAKEKQEGREAMWRAANAVICGLILATTVISVLVIIGASLMLAYGQLSPKWRLMLGLLRVMFPYLILVCFAAVCMGMLNARGYFFIPALGAGALNVAMIASVFLLAPCMGKTLETQIYALAIGVLVAGIAQAAFQMPNLKKEGYRFQWINPWTDPTVRDVVSKMLIGSIGVAAFQINVLLTQFMAFGSNDQVVATFQYAVRFMELPQGVIGISLATYLLPTLSGLFIDKKYGEFRSTLRQGMSYLIYINLLASVLLLVLAEPIVRLIFEHRKFGPQATREVSAALMCLAPGLLAFSTVNVFARAFYAMNDIITPMKISIFCLFSNLALAAVLLFGLDLGATALGIANTLTAVMNVSLLTFALRKKLKSLEMKSLNQQWPALLGAALGAGLAAYLGWQLVERFWGHSRFWAQFVAVFLPMALATLAYVGVTLWCKNPSGYDILGMVWGRLKRVYNRPKNQNP
jgi:putative peptidoglycan lipid II flippase